MAHRSFAKKVLQAIVDLGGVEISTMAVFDSLALQTRADERRALNALSDHFRAGLIVRVERGVYSLPERQTRKPQSVQARMWWILKNRKAVSVVDLQELADASENYAKEWLRMLARREVVRKLENGRYLLINEPAEMPVNDEKAEKLRRLRAEKKALIDAALKSAGSLLDEARNALKNLD